MRRVFGVICAVLALTAPWSNAASAQTICATTLHSPPGTAYPLLDWRLIRSGRLQQSHGYALLEDSIRVDIADGAALNLGPTEMQINLVTPFTGKQIVAWNQFNGYQWNRSVASPGPFEGVIIVGNNPFRSSMRITRSACGSRSDTIVLRKAGFLGFYYDMYHFDPNNFWSLWGGKIVTINWTVEGQGNPQHPSPCPSPCVPLGTLVPTVPADRAVFRSQTGEWLTDTGKGVLSSGWGEVGDVPVRGFYDLDRLSDIAIWRPSTGVWWIVSSSTGQADAIPWGENGDVPVPGDYDGDGRTELAVWRPSTGDWWVFNRTTGSVTRQQWGWSGDVPVVADFDGDGSADFTIWRPSTGTWWTVRSSDRRIATQQWGQPGDVPVAGDFDGDGRADHTIWRPSTGVWWRIASTDFAMSGRQWGQDGDVPIPGDFDHDGRADFGIWRPTTGNWHVIHSSGPVTTHQFGTWGDIPLAPAP